MKLKWDKWLYGLGSAIIGGGASALGAGLSTVLVSPNQFNLTTWDGFLKVLSVSCITFLIAGFFSASNFLKQSPLPPEVTGNTEVFTKPPTPPSA